MRKSGAVLVVLACLLVVSQATGEDTESSTRPPQHLKQVGDHWTAWDPPPAGPGAYIIVKGDTLWDLAGKWLGDPFLWPQVWDENRYILDSHWIYPGDPLVVPGKPTVVSDGGPPPVSDEPEVPATDDGTEQPDDTAVAVLDPAPLIPAAVPNDLYCSGYIDAEHQQSDLWVAGPEVDELMVYAQGDVIFLSQGANHGIRAGDEYTILRPTRQVNYPGTKKVMGQFIRRMGRARIMLTQENTSTAIIELACEDIQDKDQLVAWRSIPIPMLESMPAFDRYDVTPSGGPVGQIVYNVDERTNVAQGHVIQTDLGVASGVEPGDVLTLFRERAELPRSNLGQAVVLTVEPLSCTAKIVGSVRETAIGDGVEIVN